MGNDKKINGLQHYIVFERLERRDTKQFTYHGEGNFEIVIFDRSEVEKVCAPNATADGNF